MKTSARKDHYSIMIADDEYYARKALRKCISETFASCGISDVRITECESAEAVLELSATVRPDIVFSDIRMNGISGLDLCFWLQKEYPGTVLVIISGYADFSYAQKAIKANVFRYLLKPVDEDELLSVIQDIIEGADNELGIRSFSSSGNSAEEIPPAETLAPVFSSYSGSGKTGRYFDLVSRKLISYYLENALTENLQEFLISRMNQLIAEKSLKDSDSRHYIAETIVILRNAALALPSAALSIPSDSKAVDGIQNAGEAAAWITDVIGAIGVILRENSPECTAKKVAEYIAAHYSEDITLNDLTQQFYLHPRYLSKLIKDYTGSSFSKYLTEVRMQKAKELLENNDIPVSVAAQLTGYNSESYFIQVFKNTYQITPKDYKTISRKRK